MNRRLLTVLLAVGCRDDADRLTAAAEPLRVGAGPMRRLTPTQWRNTVRDLFPEVAVPEVRLAGDPLVHGYDDNAAAQVANALLVEQYLDAATDVSEAIALDPAPTLGCDGVTDPEGCGEAFLRALLPRAFRRPVPEEELEPWLAFFRQELAAAGFAVAWQLAAQAVLVSPEFLYLEEPGGEPGEVVAVGGHAMASRLSYLLWASLPDDALSAAAEAGELDDVEGIEAEARRMLADPKAEDGLLEFHRQWLAFDLVDYVIVDRDTYPIFVGDLREPFRREAERFVLRTLTEGDGTFSALLLDPWTEVGPDLAWIYGLEPPEGAVEERELPAGERAGILTRIAFLASHAHEVHPSPVQRGQFVLDRFLCAPAPAPPPSVDLIPPLPSDDATTTNRQRYELHETDPACAGCHAVIDGVGFGFEAYDSIGGWRMEDAGFPVDATGVFSTGDLAGVAFDGAVEASERLAGSRTALDCAVLQWARYAAARDLTEDDDDELARLKDRFAAAGGAVDELLVELVTSPLLRLRRVP